MSLRDILPCVVTLTRGDAKHVRRIMRSEIGRRERGKANQDARRGGPFVPTEGKRDAAVEQITMLKRIETAITEGLGPEPSDPKTPCSECGRVKAEHGEGHEWRCETAQGHGGDSTFRGFRAQGGRR